MQSETTNAAEIGDPTREASARARSPLRVQRRARLLRARLYLVCDAHPGGRELSDVLRAALAGGVDVVQLRDKQLGDEELTTLAGEAAALCARLGALFVVNDRPHVAAAAGADGVHVGQDDLPVAEVRRLVGPDMVIGLSTHAPAEVEGADPELVDYIGVGPVHATPTKPGRPAVGLELVAYAAAHARLPFFAIGGIDERTLPAVVAAGAERVAAVRAIADDADPERAARALRTQLGAHSARAARDARLRATLTPLGEHERSATLTVAVAVAALLAAAVLVGALTIHDLRSHGGSVPGGIFIALVLAALAAGMYRRRYWAVLGFEALLALQITLSSLVLVVATSWATVGVCLLSIGCGGWLFWKLVRVMGRIQAGERAAHGTDRTTAGRPDSPERLR